MSSSALATATAVFAISCMDIGTRRVAVRAGLNWLEKNANPDGGFGDTPDSESNLSASLLAWAAFSLGKDFAAAESALEHYIRLRTGSLAPRAIAEAVLRNYGGDKTFSVPILTMCALSGRLGGSPDCWRLVPQLPFELVLLPRKLFSVAGLPVVSYALPALISMGILRHRKLPSWSPVARLARLLSTTPALRLLEQIQPVNGAFLEAVPLSSFVCMALANSSLCDSPVARKAADFLVASQRVDGSWPVDSDLATWLTTLAVDALSEDALDTAQKKAIRNWLLKQQFKTRHPYTDSPPGGWGWTDLPGAVPDADDTAGAIIALAKLAPNYADKSRESDASQEVEQAAQDGIFWLLSLQNRDGGIPTFCRGWGKFPFDRSSPEITARTARAMSIWLDRMPQKKHAQMRKAIAGMLHFLNESQSSDGSWIPLWFGNQHHPEKINPVYGTARVLSELLSIPADMPKALDKAFRFLRNSQNPDNGWGVKIKGSQAVESETTTALSFVSSIEETAMAVCALAQSEHTADINSAKDGFKFLNQFSNAAQPPAAPIGLYFASLWYSEKLYPVIFRSHAEKFNPEASH